MATKKPSWDQASQLAEAVVRRAREAGNLERMLTSMLATNYTNDASQFEADWQKLFGDAEEVPASDNVDATIELLDKLGAEIEKDDRGHIEALILHGPRINDETMESIKGLESVRKLYLKSTRVGDPGIEHLTSLSQLTELNLGGTNVTDEGLVHLKTLEHLSILYLDLTQVTDGGLAHLKELPQLRCLDLRKSRVSPEGVESFRAALPECDIAF